MVSRERGRAAVALGVMVWVVTVAEALAMGGAGAAKFLSDAWPAMFVGWGYPEWFTYVVAGVEVLGAVALLVPRAAGYGALLLATVMLGAAGTLLTTSYETQLGPTPPVVHATLLLVLARVRWRLRFRRGASRV
jgi:uncharacterized membrane protein YphA (DoxX/SURF4 family)